MQFTLVIKRPRQHPFDQVTKLNTEPNIDDIPKSR